MAARVGSIIFAVAILGALLVAPRQESTAIGMRLANTFTTVTVNGEGLDSCTDYSAQHWNTVLEKPDYYGLGVYLGGATAEDQCFIHPASFYQNIAGWVRVMPIWDDKQAPAGCGTRTYGHPMSTDPTTAKNQGATAADDAIATSYAVGLFAPEIFYLDLESANGTCNNLEKHYVDGWVKELHNYAYKAGVYGSACSPDMSIYASAAHVPDDVWIAEVGGDNTVASINASCVPASYWVNHQRIHQYTQGENFTYNGATVNVDHDCLNATVDGVASINVVCNE